MKHQPASPSEDLACSKCGGSKGKPFDLFVLNKSKYRYLCATCLAIAYSKLIEKLRYMTGVLENSSFPMVADQVRELLEELGEL